MVLAIPCPDEAMLLGVESLCRKNGAQVRRRAVLRGAPMRLRPDSRRSACCSRSPSSPPAPDEPASVPAFARERPKVESGSPVFAFNPGEDLTGFYPYTQNHGYADPNGVCTVRDGVIRISGEEFGGLATCGNFADYHLVAEWKWGGKTWSPRESKSRDSGILLHCVGPDGAAGSGWMESIECQIIEGGCGDFILVGGKGHPSLTCETRVGPDRQPYFEKGARPSPAALGGIIGGAAAPAGRTYSASAIATGSRSRPANGTGSR